MVSVDYQLLYCATDFRILLHETRGVGVSCKICWSYFSGISGFIHQRCRTWTKSIPDFIPLISFHLGIVCVKVTVWGIRRRRTHREGSRHWNLKLFPLLQWHQLKQHSSLLIVNNLDPLKQHQLEWCHNLVPLPQLQGKEEVFYAVMFHSWLCWLIFYVSFFCNQVGGELQLARILMWVL